MLLRTPSAVAAKADVLDDSESRVERHPPFGSHRPFAPWTARVFFDHVFFFDHRPPPPWDERQSSSSITGMLWFQSRWMPKQNIEEVEKDTGYF
jgi:hypothetical protein